MFDYIKNKVKGRSGNTAADGVSLQAHNAHNGGRRGSA